MSQEGKPEKELPPRLAAVIGASLQAYLEEEQRAFVQATGEDGAGQAMAPSPWGLSGRQAIMQGRLLMQRRVWK